MSSSSSSASDSEDEEEVFGRLLNIAETELVALGSRIRDLAFRVKTSDGRLIETLNGSHNLVRIIEIDGTKMAIRIPRNGQFGDLHTPAKEALESHVRTLRYIKERTTIPVPVSTIPPLLRNPIYLNVPECNTLGFVPRLKSCLGSLAF